MKKTISTSKIVILIILGFMLFFIPSSITFNTFKVGYLNNIAFNYSISKMIEIILIYTIIVVSSFSLSTFLVCSYIEVLNEQIKTIKKYLTIFSMVFGLFIVIYNYIDTQNTINYVQEYIDQIIIYNQEYTGLTTIVYQKIEDSYINMQEEFSMTKNYSNIKCIIINIFIILIHFIVANIQEKIIVRKNKNYLGGNNYE